MAKASDPVSNTYPDPWCAINPDHSMSGHRAQIASDRIHIVSKPSQMAAIEQLQNNTLVRLGEAKAKELLEKGEQVAAGNQYYLVRAAAFYVDPQFRNLQVYIFPEEKAILIISEGLSRPAVEPPHIAILIETDINISKAEIICLMAS